MTKLTITHNSENRSSSTHHLPDAGSRFIFAAAGSCCCTSSSTDPIKRVQHPTMSKFDSTMVFFNQQRLIVEDEVMPIEPTVIFNK